MTHIHLAPIRDLNTWAEQIYKVFDRFPTAWDWRQLDMPLLDVSEDNTHLYADVELPGMSKEDVKITIHKGVLTVKGERTTETANDSKKMLFRERHYGSFSRSFTLPVEVDVNKVDASFEKGVLHIAMPKINARDIEQSIEIK